MTSLFGRYTCLHICGINDCYRNIGLQFIDLCISGFRGRLELLELSELCFFFEDCNFYLQEDDAETTQYIWDLLNQEVEGRAQYAQREVEILQKQPKHQWSSARIIKKCLKFYTST